VFVSIDRDVILKQADKLLRQGKLEGAIAEYVRLVEDQPQDWNSINALGDLYVRAGKPDKAVEQYLRIADHQFSEGFYPKSAALYKKALKLQPHDEHMQLQLATIAERQGKFVDAKHHLRQVARQREARGDQRAAAECILRLGSMPEADIEARIAGARAAQQIGDGFRAVELLKEAAQALEKQNKRLDALRLLADAAEIDPFDTELRIRLAREFLDVGQVKQARVYLNFETAGDDVELLLALATLEFADGREEDAQVAMARVLALSADREPDIAALAEELLEKRRIESAFACVDAITDAVLLQGDVPRAADVLHRFCERVPHVPALVKLVDVARDAHRSDLLTAAQTWLADVHLDAQRGADARSLAEALLRAEPANEAHANRLRRALVLLEEADPDAAVERARAGTAPPDASSLTAAERSCETPSLDIYVYPEQDVTHAAESVVESFDPGTEAPEALSTPESVDETVVLDLTEIDLSSAISGLASTSPALAPSHAAVAQQPDSPTEDTGSSNDAAAPDIEDVFAKMRARSAREQNVSAALMQYEQAAELIEQGLDKEAIDALQAAARTPMMRFRAAARLGRFLIDRGDLNEGVEWLERAAQAPAPSPDEGHDLLYELAGALEAQGESARALAVLMELEAEAEGYRDVRTRITYLSRVQQRESRRS
jgi:tetratricopeptide (TPR) repeat protein